MADAIISSATAEVKAVEQKVEAAVKAEEATLTAKVKAFVAKYYPIAIGLLIAATRFL